MKHGANTRAWWLRGAAAVGCAGCLVAAGLVARSLLAGDGDASVVRQGHGVFYRAGHGSATPTPTPTATPTPQPGGKRFAGQSDVFGLAMPGVTPDEVLFAPARRLQPAGPETVTPADVQSYLILKLAPGAEIRVTAPIANEGVTDWIHGITVTPERFAALYKDSLQRYGPMLDRGHMFELWFDGDGRIVRMIHYFSP